jgi:uncharacterized protein YukE
MNQNNTAALHALYDRAASKLFQLASIQYHEQQRQLYQDIDEANTALLELEEVVDQLTEMLEALPAVDALDYIDCPTHCPHIQRILGSHP